MNAQQSLAFAIIGLTMVMFAWGRVRYDLEGASEGEVVVSTIIRERFIMVLAIGVPLVMLVWPIAKP